MADLKTKAVSLLGSVDSINMQTETATTLYTVPVGMKCVPDHVLIRNVSASLAGCVLTFGQVGALTDFLPAHTLTNIDAAGEAVRLFPISATTPALAIVEYTAAEIIQMDITTAATGAATATVELYGTLDAA